MCCRDPKRRRVHSKLRRVQINRCFTLRRAGFGKLPTASSIPNSCTLDDAVPQSGSLGLRDGLLLSPLGSFFFVLPADHSLRGHLCRIRWGFAIRSGPAEPCSRRQNGNERPSGSSVAPVCHDRVAAACYNYRVTPSAPDIVKHCANNIRRPPSQPLFLRARHTAESYIRCVHIYGDCVNSWAMHYADRVS